MILKISEKILYSTHINDCNLNGQKLSQKYNNHNNNKKIVI